MSHTVFESLILLHSHTVRLFTGVITAFYNQTHNGKFSENSRNFVNFKLNSRNIQYINIQLLKVYLIRTDLIFIMIFFLCQI